MKAKNWGQHNITNENLTKIIKALERNRLTGGGDGSVKGNKGSHAWEFTIGGLLKTICQGVGPVDGDPENHVLL